jgi:hypothetical protein
MNTFLYPIGAAKIRKKKKTKKRIKKDSGKRKKTRKSSFLLSDYCFRPGTEQGTSKQFYNIKRN